MTETLRDWWTTYSDRIFMTKLYPKIGEYFGQVLNPHILDIGFESYNVINKDLLNNEKINYCQIEPFVGDKQYNNDKLIEGYVENLLEYEENVYKNYFDMVIDFGVLGFPTLSKNWSEKDIAKYIRNISVSLKDNGLYFLKIDVPYYDMPEYKLDFDKFIYPYFDPISFFEYENKMRIGRTADGRRLAFTARDKYDFFFLRKKQTINNLVIVAHPDDETIWAEEKLNDHTHVIVVFGHSILGKDNALLREGEFKNVRSIAKCSYEIWDFPEKKNRWDINVSDNIKKNINRILSTYKNIQTLYTHNSYGETGHMDHIRLHNIVKEVICNFYNNNPSFIIPKIYEFNPQLNYGNEDRFKDISQIKETVRRKVLLDQYVSQTVNLFRNIKCGFIPMNIYVCKDCNLIYHNLDEYNVHKSIHIEQEKYFEPFNKISFDGIEYINNVPKVVFVCLFGGYKVNIPLMSDQRFDAFKSLISTIEIPVILLTNKNIGHFDQHLNNEYKFNKSFQYLSGNHKSDYIRSYKVWLT